MQIVGQKMRGEAADVPSVVAALDLGSSKICCVIAETGTAKSHVDHRAGLRVLGFGQTVSRGIRNGSIANVEEVERAIRVAVDTAERSAGRRIRDVVVNVSGGRPKSQMVAAHVRTQTGVVSPRDLEMAVASAVGKADIGTRHVMHLTTFGHSLDNVAMDRAPLGMHGEVLGVDVGVVTLDASHLRNLSMAVERSHLKVSGFGLSAYAAGRGVLLTDEMALGALVIDLGGATTGFAVFRNGVLAASGIIPVGASHITTDIVHGLSTTMAHAERMKNMFGSVLPYAHEDREMLAVPLLGERGIDSVQQVPKSVLSNIIRPRLDEIFELIQKQVAEQGGAQGLARVVITGGGSQLQGLREYAGQVFGCTVRIGQPVVPQGIPESAKGNGLAVCVGLLSLALRPDQRVAMPTSARDKLELARMGYARRVGRWLKEAL
jgi:cell division protein FtsA